MSEIAIVGTGLIGTSLGMALHRNTDRPAVTAWDPDPESLAHCFARGGCDRTAASLAAAVERARLVVLAAPLDAVLELLPQLPPLLGDRAIVTDVAGVKRPVVTAAHAALPGRFVGGHPMAGSASRGPGAARADLFDGARWALCVEPETDEAACAAVRALVQAAGAEPLPMTAAIHDAAVSWISHLPQLVALELLAGLDDRGGPESAAGQLAAGGFRDLTRIGGSPASIWLPVLAANRRQVAADLLELSDRLRECADRLRSGDSLADRFRA